MHSSDPVTVFLAAGARMTNPSIQAVERALYEDRTVLRHHAMRRTLWVMDPAVASAAHAACTHKIAAAERKRLLGWLAATPEVGNPEAWLERATTTLVTSVSEAGSVSSRELGDQHPGLSIPIVVGSGRYTLQSAAHTRVLQLAAFQGLLIRNAPVGSWISSQYRWSAMEDWLPKPIPGLTARAGAAQLLECWLRCFGPGTEADIRWWTGWTVSTMREALQDIEAQEVEIEALGSGWIAAGDTKSTSQPASWAALLPGLDPTPMGWKERSWYLTEDVAKRVVDRNGNIGPTVWANGQIIGGWAQRPDGEIRMDVPSNLPIEQRTLLNEAAARVAALVGETRFRVRFPSPNQKELLAD